MRTKLTRNLQIGLGLSLLLLIISSIASFVCIHNLLQSSRLVDHSSQVVTRLEAAMSTMKDAETGQRGFLITGQQKFLEPYNGAYDRAVRLVKEVQDMTMDNPEQQANLDQIKDIILNRLNVLQTLLDKKMAGKAIDVQDMQAGKESMDALRTAVSQAEADEKRILAARLSTLQKFTTYTPLIIVFAALLAIAVSIFSYFKVTAEIAAKNRLQRELEEKDAETNRRIDIIQHIADQISAGDYNIRVEDHEKDDLGSIAQALNKMAAALEDSFNRLSESEWMQVGTAGLNDQMIGEKELSVLSNDILQFVADYTGSQVGALYLLNNASLQLQSGYGLSGARQEFSLGEGLVGQAALNNQPVWLQKVDNDLVRVSHATGDIRPSHILVVPVRYQGRIKGVIELAAVHPYAEKMLAFVKSVAENIGIAINSAQNHKQLQELLEETQTQSEELQAQHSELESMNTELEAHTHKLQASEEELRVQQEELQQTNLELEARNHLIEQRNQEIQQKAQQLEQSTRYKSEFMANMSHELRTPLNSILLLSHYLFENSDQNLTPEQVESAGVILSSGNGLLSLIDELLDLSKIEAGKMTLEYQQITIESLLSDMHALFTPVAAEKKLELVIENKVSELTEIETDRMRLEQILKNLLSNALKFTNAGQVKLEVRLVEALKDMEDMVPGDWQEEAAQVDQKAQSKMSDRNGEDEKEDEDGDEGQPDDKNQQWDQRLEQPLAQQLDHGSTLDQTDETSQMNQMDQFGQSVSPENSEGRSKMTGAGQEKKSGLSSESTKSRKLGKKGGKGGALLEFVVSDTGVGIPKEKQQLIFEAFQQADGSTKRKFGGTGLGLSISKELAHLLGGRISLASQPGKGSQFTLRLPLYPNSNESEDSPLNLDAGTPQPSQDWIKRQDNWPQREAGNRDRFEDQSKERSQQTSHHMDRSSTSRSKSGDASFGGKQGIRSGNDPLMEADGQGISRVTGKYVVATIPAEVPDDRNNILMDDKIVLIIEDDTAFAKALLNFTRKRGYKGIVAVRGDHGVSLAQQYKPVAILLDIQLPVKDGWEVMEELKGNSATRHIPVHVMSAMEAKRESRYKGAVDFMSKPIAMEQMKQMFQKLEEVWSKHPKKVLIVEENSYHARALASFLETFQVSSKVASSVGQSVEALQSKEVDCVILDMGIPDKNGYETLDMIKQKPGLEYLPIIVFTGKHLSAGEESRIRRYADTIVVKTAHSYQRILDEVTLFLHLVEDQRLINRDGAGNGKAGAGDNDAGGRFATGNGTGEGIGNGGIGAMSGAGAGGSGTNTSATNPLWRSRRDVLQGKSVLIADDDVRNIFSMTKSLEKHGMQVVSAMDGKEALEQLEAHPEIAIVLMDMMMPEMDGYESIRLIRQNARYSQLPIIAVTAKAMLGDREKCIAAGASDYISKPVDIDQLTSLLRVWLFSDR